MSANEQTRRSPRCVFVFMAPNTKLQTYLLTYMAEAIVRKEIIQILNESYRNDAAVTLQNTNPCEPV